MRSSACMLVCMWAVATAVVAQQPTARQVNQQVQVWTSLNSTLHLTNRWGLMADLHIRRTHGVADPSFYFARVGANWWLQDRFTLAGGYAHMWLAPATAGWSRFANEHRLYQQALMNSQIGKAGLLMRFRNEQRWQQIMANDAFTGRWKFTNRVRYLMSFSFPVSKQPGKLAVVLADEVLINFGRQVVYNTFDQNRIFLGVRHRLNKDWSYDAGYTHVFQQKPTGWQYDANHTLRLFFYYNHDFRSQKHKPRQTLDSREE